MSISKLLVEFHSVSLSVYDKRRPFGLRGKRSVCADVDKSKLTTLMRELAEAHFPLPRFVWAGRHGPIAGAAWSALFLGQCLDLSLLLTSDSFESQAEVAELLIELDRRCREAVLVEFLGAGDVSTSCVTPPIAKSEAMKILRFDSDHLFRKWYRSLPRGAMLTVASRPAIGTEKTVRFDLALLDPAAQHALAAQFGIGEQTFDESNDARQTLRIAQSN